MENLTEIITLISFVTAIFSLCVLIYKISIWFERQNKQDKELQEMKAEQKIITTGVLACLKGLAEQGCDGPVHNAIDEIEKYQIDRAHR